jgi:Zn-dependent peptidase ImmA (M78 family)
MLNRHAPDYKLVGREASALLAKYGYESPPVNPVEIARQEGIEVKFVTFTGDYEGASGFYEPEEHAIYVNKDEWPLRQTFTIAHELGHAVMHKAWSASEAYKILWRDDSRNDKADPHEKEANGFAARLLVPRFMLDRYYTLDVAILSQIFAVSVPTIKNRLAFEYGV